MPVYVDVWINERGINTYAIGRIKGGTDPDDINVYAVMDLDGIDRPLDWDLNVLYEHRYGDGLEVCIRKGLAALADMALAEQRLKAETEAKCEHVISGMWWHDIDEEPYVLDHCYCPKCGEKV
jgi:hypothetical protein